MSIRISPIGALLFAVMFFLIGRVAYPQEDTTRSAPLKLVSPVYRSGAVTNSPSYTVSDSEIAWNDYTFSGDIFKNIPGTYLANQYQPGNPSELFFDGLGGNNTKYLVDGIEMNEPTTGSLNLYHLPMEFADNVTFIGAVRAPIYQFNATGALVNIQSPLYSEAEPFSNVRHLEEPYNYLITDGIFSQNIGFNSNLDVGFERQTTDGRFLNSVYDGVNIRAKYRYSIDSIRQITATEIYYRTKGGMSGGAMPYNINANTFLQNFITLRSQTADLTYLQHHLRLSYSQSDPADSTNFFTLTGYFDYYSFKYGDLASTYYLTNLSRRFGADLRGTHALFGGKLNFGAEAVEEENPYNSYTFIPSSNRVSAYGDQEFELMGFISTGIFGRADLVGSHFYPSYGASFGIGNDIFNVKVAGGISSRVPTMSEKYFVSQNFTGNPNLKAETNRTVEIDAGMALGETLALNIKPYFRSISNPIYFLTDYTGLPVYPKISVVNRDTRRIAGVDARVRLSVWKFVADGVFNYNNEKVDGSHVMTVPDFSASGELYLHAIMFDDHLNLKIGIRGIFVGTFTGSELYPEALVYYPTSLNEFGPLGSSDLFLQAKIGDAIVYLTFFNFTGQNYFLAPVYPALDRSIGLGVDWNFLN